MYKVLKSFHDMLDNNYFYETGNEYPRKGLTVLPNRLKELSSNDNRMGEPLIEKIEEVKEEPKKKVKKSDK